MCCIAARKMAGSVPEKMAGAADRMLAIIYFAHEQFNRTKVHLKVNTTEFSGTYPKKVWMGLELIGLISAQMHSF